MIAVFARVLSTLPCFVRTFYFFIFRNINVLKCKQQSGGIYAFVKKAKPVILTSGLYKAKLIKKSVHV